VTAGKLLSRKEVIRCSTPVTLRGGRRAKLPTGTHSRSSAVVILERDLLSDSGSRPVNLQMDPEGEKPSGSVFLGGSPRTPSALTRWGEPSPRGVGCWGRGGGSEWASWGHLELLFGLRGALRSAWRSPVGVEERALAGEVSRYFSQHRLRS